MPLHLAAGFKTFRATSKSSPSSPTIPPTCWIMSVIAGHQLHLLCLQNFMHYNGPASDIFNNATHESPHWASISPFKRRSHHFIGHCAVKGNISVKMLQFKQFSPSIRDLRLEGSGLFCQFYIAPVNCTHDVMSLRTR